MQHVLLSSLPSRAPQGVTGAERTDPYWGGLFGQGTNASWMTPNLARAQADSGLAHPPAWMLADEEEAFERFTNPTWWSAKLGTLGYLGSWRTMSVEQLAAFTGATNLVSPKSAIIRDTFSARMIEHGYFTSAARTANTSHRARLLRPAYSQVVESKVLPLLTYPERIFVTGGRPYTTSRQFDRHNLLSTELGLRIAEYLDVGAVMGETYSTAEQLFAWAQTSDVNASRGKSADLTVVRPDGLRVAVELTATAVSKTIEAKTTAWANAMAGSTLATDGVFLLFVIAPPLGASRFDAAVLERDVRATITKVCAQFDGIDGQRLADRIAVARWDEWFPAAHATTYDFLSLSAWMPPTPTRPDWAKVGILDAFGDLPFEPLYPEDMTAVITNSAALATSPAFLRADITPPPVHRKPMADLGFDHEPIPPAYRRDRTYPGREGQRRGGGANITNLPPRLRPI